MGSYQIKLVESQLRGGLVIFAIGSTAATADSFSVGRSGSFSVLCWRHCWSDHGDSRREAVKANVRKGNGSDRYLLVSLLGLTVRFHYCKFGLSGIFSDDRCIGMFRILYLGKMHVKHCALKGDTLPIAHDIKPVSTSINSPNVSVLLLHADQSSLCNTSILVDLLAACLPHWQVYSVVLIYFSSGSYWSDGLASKRKKAVMQFSVVWQ
jgi:hypothetical protein